MFKIRNFGLLETKYSKLSRLNRVSDVFRLVKDEISAKEVEINLTTLVLSCIISSLAEFHW